MFQPLETATQYLKQRQRKNGLKQGTTNNLLGVIIKTKKNNGKKYGKLYNWHAVNDPRRLAPEGWHVPSDDEWTILTNYLGGEDVAGAKMKSTSGWKRDANGKNSCGFSGLPGGLRYYSGKFVSIGFSGDWWSSTESGLNLAGEAVAWSLGLYWGGDFVERHDMPKPRGYSVRCLKD